MSDAGIAARKLHEALAALQQNLFPRAGAAAADALEGFAAAADLTGQAAAHQVLAMVAGARGDFVGAISHVDAAIPLREATGDAEGLASLWQERFELSLRAGDVPGARRAMEAQLAAHERAGDREGAAHALHQLAQIVLQGGDAVAAEDYVQRALFMLDGPAGARGRAALHLLYANVWVVKGDADRAMRHAREGLELARHSRFRPGEIDALQQIGSLHAARGEWDAGRRALEEALAGRELLKDLDGRAHVLRELAGVEFSAGNKPQAFAHLDYAVRTLRDAENHLGELTMLQLLEQSADEHGDPDRARRAAEDLVDAAERSGDREALAATLVSLATRCANAAELEAARRYFARANELQQELGLLEEAAVSEGLLGQVVWAMGDAVEGRAILVKAEASLRRLGSDAADTLRQILDELDAEG